MKSNHDRLKDMFSAAQLQGLQRVQSALQENPLCLEKVKEDEKCNQGLSSEQVGCTEVSRS